MTTATRLNGSVNLFGPVSEGGAILWSLLHAASVGVSAYHGYKRNNGSIGWGIGWGILGGLFPIITPAIAVAQGLGTRK